MVKYPAIFGPCRASRLDCLEMRQPRSASFGRRIDLNDADAIERVPPLHYGKGPGFVFEVKFLSINSPPRLRLPANPAGLLQEGFIVSESLNVAPDSVDKLLAHGKWRSFRQARRLGRNRHMFANRHRSRSSAIGEFHRICDDGHGADKLPRTFSGRSTAVRIAELFSIDACDERERPTPIWLDKGHGQTNRVVSGGETVLNIAAGQRSLEATGSGAQNNRHRSLQFLFAEHALAVISE